MKPIIHAIFLFLLLCNQAIAWTHGAAQISGPTGGAVVNPGDDATGGFLNAVDAAFSYTLGGGATPAQLDVRGYPNATLTAGQTVGFTMPFLGGQTQPSTTWVFNYTPGGDAVFFLNSGGWTNISISTPGNCTISGGGTTTITMSGGLPCRGTFTWNVANPGNVSAEFRAANYAPGGSKMVISRLSDEAAALAGYAGGFITQEFKNVWNGASLYAIRTMPWMHSIDANRNTASLWAYRTTPDSLGWRGGRFPPGAWGGTASGTNQYTVSLPPDSGAGGWVDGEVIQASIVNAATSGTVSISSAVTNAGTIRLTVSSTATFTTNQQAYIAGTNSCVEANGVQALTVVNGTTLDLQGAATCAAPGSGGSIGVLTLTVTGKTGGTKLISQDAGNALGTGLVAGIGTFTYDALLDVVKWRGGSAGTGVSGGVPIEAQVAIANALNIHLWETLPTYASAPYAYATSAAALVCGLLNPWLNWMPEYSNETWNSAFPVFGYMVNQGNILSISGQSMTGLRVRQMMEAIGTQWTSSGCPSSRLDRVIAWQGFGDSGVTSQRLNGSQLNTATNSRLLAYTGSINYTTAGQRPADFAETGSYATYFSGTTMTNGFDIVRYTIDPVAIDNLQTMANLFDANPSDATALAMLNNDIRQGTIKTQAIASIAGTTITMGEAINASDSGSTISAGGSGYTNGAQILTVLGGTCTIQPKVSVTVSGNVVTTGGQVVNRGRCSVFPTMPASTSGGGGTGATVTISSTAMYANGQPGIFTVAPGGSIYSGVAANTPYFIVGVSGNTFSVANTLNGTPIALSGGSGTISFGILVNQTMLDLARNVYQNVGGNTSVNPGWEQVAATYDAYRSSVSRAPLKIRNYEGGLESKAPTATQCTSMQVLVGGSAAACAAALAAGLDAAKNSATIGKAWATDQFNQMMGRDASQPLTFGLMAHSTNPSWFVMAGPSAWALLPGGLDTTPYQTYDGVAQFNFLLKRDLDPASNDNSPMFLEKAA